MGAGGAAGGSGRDLVVMALPSVQRFITEARTTSDVAAASAIYSALTQEIVGVFMNSTGAELVLPAAGGHNAETASPPPESGVPNRVVALCPEGAGPRGRRCCAGDAGIPYRALGVRPAGPARI